MPGRIILTILLIMSFGGAEAQKSWRIKQIYRSRPPKAILVQLFTYPRRVAYYTKHKQFDKLNSFNKEAAETARQIVNDFNENFEFCPVYYYYDTNATYVRERKFKNVLLDKDLKPADNIIIGATDTNYFIVMNAMLMSEDFLPGGPTYQERESVFAARDNVNNNKQRLIVLDHKFRQLPKATVRTTSGPDAYRKSRKPFRYRSDTYNLQYAGKAATLSHNFDEFFNDTF